MRGLNLAGLQAFCREQYVAWHEARVVAVRSVESLWEERHLPLLDYRKCVRGAIFKDTLNQLLGNADLGIACERLWRLPWCVGSRKDGDPRRSRPLCDGPKDFDGQGAFREKNEVR